MVSFFLSLVQCFCIMHGDEYLRALLTVGILTGQSGPSWLVPNEECEQEIFLTRPGLLFLDVVLNTIETGCQQVFWAVEGGK